MFMAYFSGAVAPKNTRLLMYFIGFSFAKLVGILQASHCAHAPFNQWHLSIMLPTALLNAHSIICFVIGKSPSFIPSNLIIYLLIFAFLGSFPIKV
jgi:hypothetical protein